MSRERGYVGFDKLRRNVANDHLRKCRTHGAFFVWHREEITGQGATEVVRAGVRW